MELQLKLDFFLSAQPARVMQLLTDPLLIRKWSGGAAVCELIEGGQFSMFDGWVNGNVVAWSKQDLCYTWKTTDWEEGAMFSTVNFHLHPKDGGTLVTLVQTGFPNVQEMEEHKSGWTDYFFDPLEDYIMAIDKP